MDVLSVASWGTGNCCSCSEQAGCEENWTLEPIDRRQVAAACAARISSTRCTPTTERPKGKWPLGWVKFHSPRPPWSMDEGAALHRTAQARHKGVPLPAFWTSVHPVFFRLVSVLHVQIYHLHFGVDALTRLTKEKTKQNS